MVFWLMEDDELYLEFVEFKVIVEFFSGNI